MYNCENNPSDYLLMVKRTEKYPENINALQPESCIFSDKTYALHEAARLGHVNCVRFLLRSGASPDAFDCRLYTAMLHALACR
jgi:ankyrin repeat protein